MICMAIYLFFRFSKLMNDKPGKEGWSWRSARICPPYGGLRPAGPSRFRADAQVH
jgi:hypothetical protein